MDNIYSESIVIDLVAPLLAADRRDTPKKIDDFRNGGVTVVGVTLATEEDFTETMNNITQWYDWFKRYPDRVVLVRNLEDIEKCKRSGQTGIIFHFQNSVAIGQDLRKLSVFHALGVRVVQLAYSRRNFVGDGCMVENDVGLSVFGRNVIREMNKIGIVVDLSHSGFRTAMEAIEVSEKPVIFSHSNISDIHPSKRNITREQVRAVAASGGTVGLNGCEYFIKAGRISTVDDLMLHAKYLADEVGVDHISVGLDHYWGHSPHISEEAQWEIWKEQIDEGTIEPGTWPEPPRRHAKGIETPDKTFALAEALDRHGFSAADIQKILGANLMRVFKAAWAN